MILDDSLKSKLIKWATSDGKRAVEFLTIDEVDDIARWAYQELLPRGRFGMTRQQEELDDARLRLGAADSEIRMLKQALNNRDFKIKQLEGKK